MFIKSIQSAAETFNAQSSRLDILLLTAGVMSLPRGETGMGHEIQLGTNHTGHFLLVRLLLPTLVKTAEKPNSDMRIVFLSSVGLEMEPREPQFEPHHTARGAVLGARHWNRTSSILTDIDAGEVLIQPYTPPGLQDLRTRRLNQAFCWTTCLLLLPRLHL
ncbi:hypothetical protein BDV29DRAFT_163933 [Aspergillus leporis]|jgi:hypothetical protein|uniref:Uncharacterized protein n=1 Tax=Aspergillus leporis TaxID=41062 RepID=A0A5N5WG63_9EURO|nr:hypothetical protein BDV29DRAFT_163933 [Aspergillus leporis]